MVENKIDNDIYLREIEYDDKDRFDKWGKFESPFLYGYNYNDMSDGEKEIWYLMRKKGFFRTSFAVMHRNYGFIGYISIKNMNIFRKTGLLGIVFDPNYVSMGYGTKALEQLLDIYFNNMKYKILYLEVNSFNKRARSLYEKLGFEYYGETSERFENQDISEEEICEKGLENDFFFQGFSLFSKIYKMKLERSKYEQISNK